MSGSLIGSPDPGGHPHVVVVGGGIAGLAAAWELLSGPGPKVHVTVLEQGPRVGGKLSTTELSGVSGPVSVDAGAESMLARRSEGTDLAREVGLGDALVVPAAADAQVFSRGALHPLPSGTVLGVPTDPARLAGGLLSAAEIERVGADARTGPDELTRAVADGMDVAVGELVARRMGAAVVDRLVEPLLGGVYAGHARELSLQLTSPALAAALRGETGGSLLAAAREAAGWSRPAATTAGGVATGTPVFAGLRAGLGRLPGAVAHALADRGARILTDTAVHALAPVDGGWRVSTGPVPRPGHLTADAVVLAVPAAPAGRLLRGAGLPGPADTLGGVAAASVALVHLAVRAADAVRLTGSGILVPPVEGLTVKAATWSSRKWAWQHDEAPDTVLLRASVGRYREQADLARPDAELVQVVLTDLARITGADLRAGLVDARVVRWGGGLPQYQVGHADRVTAVRSGLPADGTLVLAGAAYDGVGIPACIASGRAAARALRTVLAAAPGPVRRRSVPDSATPS